MGKMWKTTVFQREGFDSIVMSSVSILVASEEVAGGTVYTEKLGLHL